MTGPVDPAHALGLNAPAPGAAGLCIHAAEAAAMMRASAHERRLMIPCHLAAGEKTVTQLEQLLDQRQSPVSQHLARLRAEGLIACRHEGKARLSVMADPRASQVIAQMHRLFGAT